MQSKPGPMLAIEAGTLIRISLQLQDLSECARVAVKFDGRLDVFERRIRVFESRAGQDHHYGRILFNLSIADESEQQGKGRRRRGLGEKALAVGEPDLGGEDLDVGNSGDQ